MGLVFNLHKSIWKGMIIIWTLVDVFNQQLFDINHCFIICVYENDNIVISVGSHIV